MKVAIIFINLFSTINNMDYQVTENKFINKYREISFLELRKKYYQLKESDGLKNNKLLLTKLSAIICVLDENGIEIPKPASWISFEGLQNGEPASASKRVLNNPSIIFNLLIFIIGLFICLGLSSVYLGIILLIGLLVKMRF